MKGDKEKGQIGSMMNQLSFAFQRSAQDQIDVTISTKLEPDIEVQRSATNNKVIGFEARKAIIEKQRKNDEKQKLMNKLILYSKGFKW